MLPLFFDGNKDRFLWAALFRQVPFLITGIVVQRGYAAWIGCIARYVIHCRISRRLVELAIQDVNDYYQNFCTPDP